MSYDLVAIFVFEGFILFSLISLLNYFFKFFITICFVFAWPSKGNFVNNGGGMTKRGGNIEWKSRCVS